METSADELQKIVHDTLRKYDYEPRVSRNINDVQVNIGTRYVDARDLPRDHWRFPKLALMISRVGKVRFVSSVDVYECLKHTEDCRCQRCCRRNRTTEERDTQYYAETRMYDHDTRSYITKMQPTNSGWRPLLGPYQVRKEKKTTQIVTHGDIRGDIHHSWPGRRRINISLGI